MNAQQRSACTWLYDPCLATEYLATIINCILSIATKIKKGVKKLSANRPSYQQD